MKLPEVRTLYNRLKTSAKKRNIEFNLSISDMYHVDYPLTCPILGIKLAFNKGKVQDNSYSVDRIDNSIGYQLDNIQMISYRANKLKNDASATELQMLSGYFK